MLRMSDPVDPVVKVSQKKKKDRNFTILGSIEKGTSTLSLYKETIVLLFFLEQCLWSTLLDTAGQQWGHDLYPKHTRACTHTNTHTPHYTMQILSVKWKWVYLGKECLQSRVPHLQLCGSTECPSAIFALVSWGLRYATSAHYLLLYPHT